jgi:murein DD-endopeptidase MepM/ murein hydrolase activator NlpD
MKNALGALIATLVVAAAVLSHAQSSAPSDAQPLAPSDDLPPGAECPLGRVAMVRGSESEAREGGGFYAARRNGIHGAVDLDGWVGEPVFAVASGKAIVAEGRSDWGKLGRTVVIDHRDGGYTLYAHLHTVEVKPQREVASGDMIGTIGYSGNAAGLRAKKLPPHLHFAYFRAVSGVNAKGAPLSRMKDSAEGFRFVAAKDAIMADLSGIVNPIKAVKFMKCWSDPPAATTVSTPSTFVSPDPPISGGRRAR